MKYQNLNLTDDAGLLEKEGIKVKVVEGEKSNIKITTREDLYY
jgi:2-C-methyl-D-erythritol 4-phosphate cytidylyltransferase